MQNISLTKHQLKEASERIAPYIHHTPIFTSRSINSITGAQLFFKCENLQKVGAFKMRGATNAVFSLPPEERKKGVATHSSGNHAQAVALAAREAGVQAYIVMPENSPKVKVAAVKGYGAEVIFCENTIQAREETLEGVIERTGATLIHPYNDFRVIAGQATAAMELFEQVEEPLEVLITPVGGGGLLSGTALAARFFSPDTTVIAGEPAGADDAWKSLKSGKLMPQETTNTMADGLLVPLGSRTFPLIQEHIKEIILVSEEEIVEAMRLIWQRMKLVVEPSGAVPLAAILKTRERWKDKKIGLILTGGNVDIERLPF